MPGFFKRFGRGAVAGAEGATAGLLQNLLMQREQERFEGEQAETQKTSNLQRLLLQARIDEMQQEEPEKPPREAEEFGRLLRDDPEEYIRIKRAVSGKGEAKKDPTIGNLSISGLLGERKKASGAAIKEYSGTLKNQLDLKDLPSDVPRDIMASALRDVPQTKSTYWGLGEDEPNPEFTDIMDLITRLGPVPQPYKTPSGEPMSALQDSVRVAQTGRADVLGALKDYKPYSGAESPQAILDLILGKIQQPEGQQQQQDPEILKAQQALERGDITQEEFDEFVKERNASYVR